MILPFYFLSKFVYTDEGSHGANINEVTLYDTYTDLTVQSFFMRLIGFVCTIALLWLWFVLLSYILERKHAISIRKVSFFKILTFGKLQAAEVTPMQIFWIFLIAHVIIILVYSGALAKIIIMIMKYIVDLYYKIVGG